LFDKETLDLRPRPEIAVNLAHILAEIHQHSIIPRTDNQGGTGANFIVAWGAEDPVFEPVVEAVMISVAGTQKLSLLSLARVLEEKRP
jgi:hypothetical protein